MKWIKKLCAVFVAAVVLVACSLSAPMISAKADTTVDITQNVSGYDWVSQSELKVTYLDLGTGVLPDGIGYGIIDKDGYKYAQDYIAVNGRTVREINSDTSLKASSWTYTVFPSTLDGTKYKLPIIVYVNNGKIEIKIHSNYVAMLGERVEITVKAGLYFKNGATRYEVTEDKTFTVWEAPVITNENISDKVTLLGWEPTGNESELTYARLVFEQGILPSGIDYGILDKPDYKYLQEYILLNGKSLLEINTTTDVSSYVFSTFPSNAADAYKIPVIIFVNGNAIEIKVHNEYLKTLSGDLEITVKEGFSVLNGNKRYVVEKAIEYMLVGNVWADKNKTYSVTYYLNGEQYGDVDKVLANNPLVVRDAPQTEAGYAFGGWEYTATETVAQDMAIYGYVKPIRYSVSYHLDGGVNASTNPIVYYVTDGEITLQAAEKSGAVFKGWYSSADYAERVETLSPDRLGDITLYALFENVENVEEESGCGSVLSVGSACLMLAGLALFYRKRK